MTHKDPTFDAVQKLQIADKKCSICTHRGEQLWESWTCKKGLAWPKFGRCKTFKLESEK